MPSPRLTSLNAATKDLDEAVWLNLSLLGTAAREARGEEADQQISVVLFAHHGETVHVELNHFILEIGGRCYLVYGNHSWNYRVVALAALYGTMSSTC